jgi:hypothetical protein
VVLDALEDHRVGAAHGRGGGQAEDDGADVLLAPQVGAEGLEDDRVADLLGELGGAAGRAGDGLAGDLDAEAAEHDLALVLREDLTGAL